MFHLNQTNYMQALPPEKMNPSGMSTQKSTGSQAMRYLAALALWLLACQPALAQEQWIKAAEEGSIVASYKIVNCHGENAILLKFENKSGKPASARYELAVHEPGGTPPLPPHLRPDGPMAKAQPGKPAAGPPKPQMTPPAPPAKGRPTPPLQRSPGGSVFLRGNASEAGDCMGGVPHLRVGYLPPPNKDGKVEVTLRLHVRPMKACSLKYY